MEFFALLTSLGIGPAHDSNQLCKCSRDNFEEYNYRQQTRNTKKSRQLQRITLDTVLVLCEDKESFASTGLRQEQVETLWRLSDTNKNGLVSYTEFAQRLHEACLAQDLVTTDMFHAIHLAGAKGKTPSCVHPVCCQASSAAPQSSSYVLPRMPNESMPSQTAMKTAKLQRA
eukprot:1294187-Amphidinium_carterae.1